MRHVYNLNALDVVLHGVRAAALLYASDEFDKRKTVDEHNAFAVGFEIFNEACLTALGAVAGLPGPEDPSEWDAIVAGTLAAVGASSWRLTDRSPRAVLGYTVANAYVLDALSEAALGVAAETLAHD